MAGGSDKDETFVSELLEKFRCGIPSRMKGRSSIPKLKFDTPSHQNSTATVKRSLSKDDISSIPKRMKVNDAKSVGSPWESCRLRAELVDARADVVMLESRINKLHAMRMEMEVLFQSEKNTLLELQDRDRNTIKELEKRLKLVRRRELENREELVEYRKITDSSRFKKEATIQSLQKENAMLKDKVRELGFDSHKTQRSTEHQALQLEAELGETVQELVDLRDRNSDLEERLQEATVELLQGQKLNQKLQEAQARVKELEREQEMNEEAMSIVKAHQYKVLHYSELEKELSTLRTELKRLKEAITQKLLLEEMVQDLQSRQAKMEENERELVRVQGVCTELDSALNEWRAVAKDHCEKNVEPAAIRRRMGELQQRVLLLTSDTAQLKSQLKACHMEQDALQLKVDKLKEEAEQNHAHQEQQTHLVRRLQKKLLLISRERDSYRSQLDLYEKDLTIVPTATPGNTPLQQQRLRIDSLEKMVEGYRDLLERLESELENKNSGGGSLELVEKLSRVESERDTLLKEKERLLKRKDELEQMQEYRALKGEFNPTTSKLLHFRLNPVAEAEAKQEEEFEAMKVECERLRTRVKVLEEGNMEDVTVQVNKQLASSSSQGVEELREQLKSSDLKWTRLMEVFKASSREFRDVCYTLLGYKVDRLQTNNYKLTSMYAESPTDHLMFKVLPEGEVNLLETEFSASLGELVCLHLQQHHSFPMFLYGVNQELFQRQTMMQQDPLSLV